MKSEKLQRARNLVIIKTSIDWNRQHSKNSKCTVKISGVDMLQNTFIATAIQEFYIINIKFRPTLFPKT